jgi:hypothetical protein
MTAPAIKPHDRTGNVILQPKEPADVTEETPEQSWPKPRGAHFSFTAAILVDHPHLADIFRANQVRPPTPDEAAMYEQRLSDPKWAWLLALVGETHPLRPTAGPEPGPIVITREELTQVWDEQHPAEPAPVAADPEPAGDPAEAGEDVSPQPEAAEPAPDATQVLNPGEAMTALLPPVEAPTAMLPVATDEDGGES